MMQTMRFFGSPFTVACMLIPQLIQAQTPPPNDNFTNRTILSGSPVTFSGTTSNATSEVGILPDVWYSWTASETSRVILERLSYFSTNPYAPCELQVFVGDNFNGTNLQSFSGSIDIASLDWRNIPSPVELDTFRSYLSFHAVAGTTYYLRFWDEYSPSSAQFTMKLFTTNAPVIVAQPQDQIATANDSANFMIKVYDHNILQYQWRHHGTNLYGQTAPTLMLLPGVRYINTVFEPHWTLEAGDYDVVISDPTGTNYTLSTTSAIAHLTLMPPPPIPAKLAVLGTITNRVRVQLDCEADREFVAAFSTNLTNWLIGQNGYFIENSNPKGTVGKNAVVGIVMDAGRNSTFLSVQRWISPIQVCTNNLKLIRFAKEQWAVHNFKNNTDTPTYLDDLFGPGKFIRGVYWGSNALTGEVWSEPICPANGTYTIGGMTTKPACTVPSHTLSD